jgi:tetratricopeptide (TPR) repeat protein
MHRLDGEYEESLKAFEKLTRLDPAARAVAAYNRSRIFLYQKEYDKAIAELDKGARVEPNHPMIKIFRAAVWFHTERKEDAIDAIKEVLKENPRMDGIKPLLALFLAGAGHMEEARAQLTAEALTLSKSDHDMAYWVASAYSQLGETDLAFKWLNKAVKLGNENKPFFENDPSLEPLRSDERWPELIGKIHANGHSS